MKSSGIINHGEDNSNILTYIMCAFIRCAYLTPREDVASYMTSCFTLELHEN